MVNILSPVSSWGVFAIDILEPDKRRISVILVPFRPMMQPTMSDGIEIFWVRRLAGGWLDTGELALGEDGGEERRGAPSPFFREELEYDEE